MSEQSSPPGEHVRRRSKNACDACRARKVKCIILSDASVCRTCGELGIPCLHELPRKKRGPANQYVLSQTQDRRSTHPSVSASPRTPVSLNLCGSDRLAPMTLIERIVHDWFDLIHSVAPIFHRATFLNRLRSGESRRDSVFAGLVIAVCSATIASLRRKGSIDYGGVSVERCLTVVEQIEFVIGKQPWTLDSCQMKYHLGVSLLTERSLDDQDSFRLFSESAAAAKYLIYYQMPQIDHVSQQLLKRQFWLIFVGFCTLSLHGRHQMSILTSSDSVTAYMPLELSDNELDPTQSTGLAEDWHGNTRSYVPGLIHLTKLFLLWHESQQGSRHTISHLQHYSNLVQRELDYLPPELKWRGGLSRPPGSNFGTDVQMANLYITQLHVRSNLLEQMKSISKVAAQPSPTPEIVREQQSIVEDMLEILYHVPQTILEANGHSLIPKIRDIGSALLDQVGTGDGGRGMSPAARANLDRLLAKLESLDIQSRLQYMERGHPSGIGTQL